MNLTNYLNRKISKADIKLTFLKRYFILTIFLAVSSGSHGTTAAYKGQMKSALDRLEVSESIKEYEAVAKDFQKISNTNPEEWLPKYYMAACYVFITLIEDIKLSEDEIKNYQEKADELLERLKKDHSRESEIHALTALYYVSKVTHGPLYMMMINYWKFQSALSKSLELDPHNPRAIYQQLASDMGKAEKFNNDISQYCERASHLLDEWDSYPLQSELHPTWGKRDLAKLLAKCNKL